MSACMSFRIRRAPGGVESALPQCAYGCSARMRAPNKIRCCMPLAGHFGTGKSGNCHPKNKLILNARRPLDGKPADARRPLSPGCAGDSFYSDLGAADSACAPLHAPGVSGVDLFFLRWASWAFSPWLQYPGSCCGKWCRLKVTPDG